MYDTDDIWKVYKYGGRRRRIDGLVEGVWDSGDIQLHGND